MNTENEDRIPNEGWSQFWTHRSTELFANFAPKNLFDNDADAAERTFSDWNRLIESKAKCSYYINGKRLSDLRDNQPFADMQEFKTFLRDQLLANYSQNDQEKMLGMLLSFGYQAALPHATNSAVLAMAGANSDSAVSMAQPDMRIDWWVENGALRLKEGNKYRKWFESGTKRHECSDEKEYYLRTETTYLIAPGKIDMEDLILACPSRNLAPFLDRRPKGEQITRFSIWKEFIASIIQIFFPGTVFDIDAKPESTTLYEEEVDVVMDVDDKGDIEEGDEERKRSSRPSTPGSLGS
ncbi:MAG: hypothetical protein NXI01_04375 [Gammaproteobacteria bacterium]|nr:hypothetical protein [Gammaproteobacteria bacterium]